MVKYPLLDSLLVSLLRLYELEAQNLHTGLLQKSPLHILQGRGEQSVYIVKRTLCKTAKSILWYTPHQKNPHKMTRFEY